MSSEAPGADTPSTRPRFHELHDKVFAYDSVQSGMLTVGLGLVIAVLTFGVLWMTNLDWKPANSGGPVVAVEGPDDGEAEGKKGDNPDPGELPEEMPNKEEAIVDTAPPDLTKDLLNLIQTTDFTDQANRASGGNEGGGSGLGTKGTGFGKGGSSPEQRWLIEYGNETRAGYRKKLDFFEIHVAAFFPGGRVVGTMNVSTSPKQMQIPNNWFYFQPKDPGRIAADKEVLESAGVQVTPGAIIVDYYPPKLEAQLLKLELEAAKRPVKDIKKTVFGIRSGGGGYELYVENQTFN